MNRKNSFAYIFFIVLCGSGFCPHARSATETIDWVAFRPSRTVGQTWYVEVETLTQHPGKPDPDFVPQKITYGYRFDVEARCEVEEELCDQIRVEAISVNGRQARYGPLDYRGFYRFFLRVDDGSLKVFQCFRGIGDDLPILFSLSYPREPITVTDSTGFLPADFPVFSPTARNHAPGDSTDPNGPTVARPLDIRQKQEPSKEVWAENGTERAAIDISLVRDHGPQVGMETSKQVWTKGLPWPLLTEYKRGRKPALTARLVSIDGSPVTISPQD